MTKTPPPETPDGRCTLATHAPGASWFASPEGAEGRE